MARRDFRPGLLAAQQFVAKESIDTLPVDPFKIAASREILVEPKDCEGGVSGMLLRYGNRFTIVYARNIPNPGYQRFSVAHELGHYFLPGHPENIFRSQEIHRSNAEFRGTDEIEREADDFAAGLLMPTPLIKRELIGVKDGLTSIRVLHDRCGSSMVASAIRYIDVARVPAAIIVSRNDHVDFCFSSDELREFRGLSHPRAGSAIPKDSLTEHFHRNPKMIDSGRTESDPGMLRDWFGSSHGAGIIEEVVGLGGYHRVLTVITATSMADDEDEQSDVYERWAPPTFGR